MGQMHRIRSRRHDAYSLRDRVTNGIIMICQTSQGKEQGSTKNRQPGAPFNLGSAKTFNCGTIA